MPPASSRGIVFGYRINRIKDKAGGGKSKAECSEENGRCQAHVDQKSETSSRILHLDTGKSSRHGVEIDMLLHAQNLTGSWGLERWGYEDEGGWRSANRIPIATNQFKD